MKAGKALRSGCVAIAFSVCQNVFMATETRDIQKHVLPNGLVVITETMRPLGKTCF